MTPFSEFLEYFKLFSTFWNLHMYGSLCLEPSSLSQRVILPDRSSKTTLSKKTAPSPIKFYPSLLLSLHFSQLATFLIYLHTVFPPQSYLKNKLHQEWQLIRSFL